MGSMDLLLVCSLSFLFVFIVLSVLALVMQLIMILLPHRDDNIDPSIYAAITASAARAYPGRKITKIEEIK